MSRIAVLVAVCCLVVPVASATTYVMMHDDVLADQATLIIIGHVESVENLATQPMTRYQVRIERLLKGQHDSDQLYLDVVGGPTPDGKQLLLFGTPHFSVGERTILFLGRRSNESFGPLHVGLGVFRELNRSGQIIAYRHLGGSSEVSIGIDLPSNLCDLKGVVQTRNGVVELVQGRGRKLVFLGHLHVNSRWFYVHMV